jgi:hypothetical protein
MQTNRKRKEDEDEFGGVEQHCTQPQKRAGSLEPALS